MHPAANLHTAATRLVESAHALEQAAINEKTGRVGATLNEMLIELNRATYYLRLLAPEEWEILREKQPELLETLASEIRSDLEARRSEQGGEVGTSAPSKPNKP